LKYWAQHPKVVAIGETGLDYFHEDTPESRKTQEDVFRKHIALAQKVNKPLMLHVRASKGSDDAYYDALEILKFLIPTLFPKGRGSSLPFGKG
jgi:TatD DNase family protein